MRWCEKTKRRRLLEALWLCGFVVEYSPHKTVLSGTRKSPGTGATGLYKPAVQYDHNNFKIARGIPS